MDTMSDLTRKIADSVSRVNTSTPPSPPKPYTGVCKPDCEICGGIGWIRQDLPVGDPGFGKAQLCPNVDLFTHYKGRSGLESDERDLSWSNIADFNGVGKAVEAVQTVVELGFGWIFLWGDFGLAKSLILKTAVSSYIRERKEPASYVRMAELLDHLRSAYDSSNPSEDSQARLDFWSTIPLLCIDEFDRVRETAYASERRFVLMDRRYEKACGRKNITIMASNSDPALIDGYLRDRIFDGRFKVIKLVGKSARPMMSY